MSVHVPPESLFKLPRNTHRYSHVAAKLLREVKGPLEYLELKASD